MEQVPGSRAVSQNEGITVPVNHNMRTVTSLEILTPYQVPACGLQNANRGNPQTGQYQQGSQQTFQRPFQCSFLLYAGIPSTLLDENRRVLFHAKKNFSIKMPRDCWDSLSWDNFLGIWSPDRYYIRSIYKVFPSMRVLLCFVSHPALSYPGYTRPDVMGRAVLASVRIHIVMNGGVSDAEYGDLSPMFSGFQPRRLNESGVSIIHTELRIG